ncbi:MAG: hypothetical protein J6V01_08520 [Clostridia bacterium]|nr:hypothetical protein [Clostridia bacterium]
MRDKLKMWQDRLAKNDSAWSRVSDKFDKREMLVRGQTKINPVVDNDLKRKAYHVRNVCAELVEAQVDTTIPAPKVTARHKEDEKLAKIIEDMLLDEINRLPMEEINDMMERTVPIQGGGFYLFEWDNSKRTQNTIGELTVQYIHPKQFVPQNGVFSGIEDMDYFFLKLPQTKEYIKNRYGISLADEGEQEPEARGLDEESASDSMVTQYVAYYRNERGGVGKYSWVADTELEDLEDYQERMVRKCKKCGAVEPISTMRLPIHSTDGTHPYGDREGEENDWVDGIQGNEGRKVQAENIKQDTCPYCGAKAFETHVERFEEIFNPRQSTMGVPIPGATPVPGEDEEGNPITNLEPAKIPYYTPDIYPVILQKSVSIFGQLMGDSDVDKIEHQQNSLNRLAAKMLDITIKSGSFATLPPDATIRTDNEDMKFIRLENPADKQMIDVFEMLPGFDEVNGLFTLYSNFYEEARQAIGITDSFQGRRDTTATSGKAKEFAAQQSAGRLESKRAMKDAAYQRIYEAMFKFKLAYADEPRPILGRDSKGGIVYEIFDRYDFLKQDESGEYYWNDQFIFDIDNAAPLSRDREALWQETRMNLQTGAFGDPTSLDTLVLFWKKMDEYHYPGAADTKSYLIEMQQKQQQAMMMQQQQMAMIEDQRRQVEEDALEAQAVTDILKGGKMHGRESASTSNPNKPAERPTRLDARTMK